MELTRERVLSDVLCGCKGGGTYLEIGIRYGTTFREINARVKLGVDPELRSRRLRFRARLTPVLARIPGARRTLLYALPSDDFFRTKGRVLRSRPVDAALVDGLHTADQALRDIENCLRYLAPTGVIVVHDCMPGSETQGAPTWEQAQLRNDFDGKWNGEVWKAIVHLRSTREDLRIRVFRADEGIGIVAFGEPESLLSLGSDEIRHLTYADLKRDESRLLNVHEPDQWPEYVEILQEHANTAAGRI